MEKRLLKKNLKNKLRKDADINFYSGFPVGKIIVYRSNLFDTAADMIEDAKERVIVVTYEFEKKSIQAEKIFKSIISLNDIIDDVSFENFEKENPNSNFDILSKTDKQKYASESGYTIPVKIVLAADRPALILKQIRNKMDAEVIPKHTGINFLKETMRYIRKSPYIKFDYEYHLHWEFDTSHAKYVIVDNKVLIGSANINDRSYFEAGRIIKGPIVDEVANSFHKDVHPKFSDLKKKSSKSRYRRLSRTFVRKIKRKRKKTKIKKTKSIKSGNYFIITTPTNEFLAKKPNASQQRFMNTVFRNTKKNIKLFTPNLNYDGFEQDIIGSIKRGSSVEIILSKNFGDPNEGKDGGTNQQSVDTLVEMYYMLKKTTRSKIGSLKIGYFRDPKNIPKGDETYFRQNEKNLSHVKLYIFDDVCSVWGSMNLDNQSNRSHELCIGSFNGKQVSEDVAFFNKNFRNTLRFI
jgi:phosphatidylserine/phosphatidylglycerophosphate/cardiolipin synthase-like enzyme